jgi:hypothetical protein
LKKIFGFILSALAWLIAAIAICGSVIYAVSVMMWLHAPILMVLVVTLPIMLLLLGITWALNKIEVKLRS